MLAEEAYLGWEAYVFKLQKNTYPDIFLNTPRNFRLGSTGWKPLNETYTFPTKLQW